VALVAGRAKTTWEARQQHVANDLRKVHGLFDRLSHAFEGGDGLRFFRDRRRCLGLTLGSLLGSHLFD